MRQGPRRVWRTVLILLQCRDMLTRLRQTLDQEQPRLFLWVPVLLALGIAAFFALKTDPVWWAVTPVFVVALGGAFIKPARLGAVCVLLVALGFAAAQVETWVDAGPMLTRDLGFTDLSGHIVEIEALPDGRRLTLDALTIERLPPEQTPQQVRVLDRKAAADVHPGHHVALKASLRAISEPVLPGDYDFRRNAYFNQLGATGFIAGPVTVLQPGERSFSFAGARAGLAAQIRQRLTGDEAAISDALLTGDQTGISEDTLVAMRLSGLTHILSVSGLHIGAAAAILFFLTRAILAAIPAIALRHPIKKWAALLAFAGALGYTLFAGAPVPAVRSLLMTGVALLAIVFDRAALSLRTVALSATAILLIVPHSLLGPSFQLSYAAIIAIIAAYEESQGLRERIVRPKWLPLRAVFYIGAIALTSLIASLATAPLTHYHFQQLSLYGVFSNMLAVPLTSFWLMPAALLALAALPFGLAQGPLWLLGQGVAVLIAIAQRTAALPGADWAPANMRLAAVLLIVAGALWLLIWQTRWRHGGWAPLMLGLVIACFPQHPDALVSGDGKFAALRTTQGGYALVSDTGRRHEDGFVPDQWRRWLGVTAFEAASCDDSLCQVDGRTVVRDGNVLPLACNGKGTVIYLGGKLRNCAARDVDHTLLRRQGSVALYEGSQMETVQAGVGDRPWNLRTGSHYRYDPQYRRNSPASLP